jgi:hypothetical protein
MMIVFEPITSPVASYHRGRGISIVWTFHSACNSSHSRSRSLWNTPSPPGGSDRTMSFCSLPSAVRTSATAVTRL